MARQLELKTVNRTWSVSHAQMEFIKMKIAARTNAKNGYISLPPIQRLTKRQLQKLKQGRTRPFEARKMLSSRGENRQTIIVSPSK
eukprot:gene1220-12393_t